MNHDDRQAELPKRTDCPRTRLAENGVGAVELCRCGMWQLHVGALTIRLAPDAISELLGLLGHAVAEHAARRLGSGRAAGTPCHRPERGDA